MDEEKQAGDGVSSGWGHELWEIIKVLLVSLVIVLPIRYFIVQPFIVRGASMEPNFQDREYLIIDEVSYYFKEPRRGDVIVFRYPRNPRQFFIKRIVALPEERIEIAGGRVKIFNGDYKDGLILKEGYLSPPNRATGPEVILDLDSDEYFVLGDNRDFSSDSRVWGALDENLIVGRAFFRVWPFDNFGLVSDYAIGY